jgi:diacylglycerol kinase family enzyme
MRALVLHNPTAGAGGVSRKELSSVLRAAGIDCRYLSTKEKRYAKALADTDQVDVVIAAGGDGTVAKAVKYIGDRETPIAILPLGGSNNIARSFGMDRAWQEIPARWNLRKTRKLAVGVARGPWGSRMFIEGCGLGAIARTAAKGSDQPHPAKKIQRGRNILRKILSKGKSDWLKLDLDGKPWEGEALMFEAMNIRYAGPSVFLANGNPGDGFLDLVCVTPEHRDDMIAWLVEPHDKPPSSIFHRRAKRIAFEWDGVPLHIDDFLPKSRKYPGKVEIELRARPATMLALESAR